MEDIKVSATKLAIRFTKDKDIPERFLKRNWPMEIVQQSKKEYTFESNINFWEYTIQGILDGMAKDQALRVITLSPSASPQAKNVADDVDFKGFTDYLIEKRDQENCSPQELGRLVQLHTAFQHEVERMINEY